jgi:hypothetical protein
MNNTFAADNLFDTYNEYNDFEPLSDADAYEENELLADNEYDLSSFDEADEDEDSADEFEYDGGYGETMEYYQEDAF